VLTDREVQGNRDINLGLVCYRFDMANESKRVTESTNLFKRATRSTAEDEQ
jgi:hypothetical protein